MPTTIRTIEELESVAVRFIKILPRICPRNLRTLMYASITFAGARWIFYVGGYSTFIEDDDKVFFGYSTGPGDGWMAFALSHFRTGIEKMRQTMVVDIFDKPTSLRCILRNRGMEYNPRNDRQYKNIPSQPL